LAIGVYWINHESYEPELGHNQPTPTPKTTKDQRKYPKKLTLYSKRLQCWINSKNTSLKKLKLHDIGDNSLDENKLSV
ncbi:24016_t:CDS:2, partial [Dentiscutata erythropus]